MGKKYIVELKNDEQEMLTGLIVSGTYREFLASETLLWETERNTNKATVDWRFTTAEARIRLKKLYPVIHYEDNVKGSLPLKA
jgi:hypothetical protein